MDKDIILKNVQSLGKWYQRINFDGVITTPSKISGISLWKVLKEHLPKDLTNCRILDLGCNAGFFTVQTAILGAESIGIERSTGYLKQANFVKTFFEEKLKKELNVRFIQSDISDIDFSTIGYFDYVFCLAILYHIGKHKYGKYTEKTLQEQEKIIEKLTRITHNIIVRTRNTSLNDVNHYNDIFKKFNFNPVNVISQGKRSLVLYNDL